MIAPRSSASTAPTTSGTLIEYDDVETIFRNPKDQRTREYVTGQFG